MSPKNEIKMINIQKYYLLNFGPIRSTLVLFGPLWSNLLYNGPNVFTSVLFSPLWSYSILFGSIRSTFFLFGLYWSSCIHFSPIRSTLVLFIPNYLPWSTSVILEPFNPLHSLFGPFCPLWFYFVHIGLISSILSTLVLFKWH